MKFISCVILGLIVRCTHGYIGLEIEVDGTVHLLHLDPCFTETAVSDAVDVFISSSSFGLHNVEESTCPISSPNCVRTSVLTAALKSHEANLAACGVSSERAKSVPAAVGIAGIDADFCTTIVIKHGEIMERALPEGPLPDTGDFWKIEKRVRQAAVMRYVGSGVGSGVGLGGGCFFSRRRPPNPAKPNPAKPSLGTGRISCGPCLRRSGFWLSFFVMRCVSFPSLRMVIGGPAWRRRSGI